MCDCKPVYVVSVCHFTVPWLPGLANVALLRHKLAANNMLHSIEAHLIGSYNLISSTSQLHGSHLDAQSRQT